MNARDKVRNTNSKLAAPAAVTRVKVPEARIRHALVSGNNAWLVRLGVLECVTARRPPLVAGCENYARIEPEIPRRLVGTRVLDPLLLVTLSAQRFGLFGTVRLAVRVVRIGVPNIRFARAPLEVVETIVRPVQILAVGELVRWRRSHNAERLENHAV
jgi:hypothetical protein